MSAYRRILVATDFSPASAPAFDEALRLAKGSRAQLLVAHAYQEHDLPAIGFAATTAFDEWDRESRERALGQLDLLLARARREGIDAHPLLLAGFPDEAIVFYPQVISEVMGQLPFNESVDYYPGCYRLHARLSPAPMDLRSTEDVFSKLQGLRVRRIDAPKCCYTPEGLSHMVENAKAALMVHVCTGCYGQAIKAMEGRKGTKVLMLPELVERAIGL